MRRTTGCGLGLAALLAALLAGCSSDDQPAAAPPSTGPPTEATSAPPTTEAAPTTGAPPTTSDPAVAAALAALEESYGARLGVFARDTGTGKTVEHRADERFAYASTHKALSVAAVLQAT